MATHHNHTSTKLLYSNKDVSFAVRFGMEILFREHYTQDDIGHIARRILDVRNRVQVFAFNGDFGAGKTTMIKSMCEQLGIDVQWVNSPSFRLIHEYDSPLYEQTIVHIDLYRLTDVESLYHLGAESYLDNHLCLIEWTNRFPQILKHIPHLFIQIEEAMQRHARIITTTLHNRT